MTESTSRTQVCSVVFLDIVEYAKKPVGMQLLRDSLELRQRRSVFRFIYGTKSEIMESSLAFLLLWPMPSKSTGLRY